VSVSSELMFLRKLALYRWRIGVRKATSPVLGCSLVASPSQRPPVTLFISSWNTVASLKLTLDTIGKTADYSNYRLLVADGGSTDGSLELLERYQALSSRPVRVIRSAVPLSHQEWLDVAAAQMDTPYWVAIDSDMCFIGRSWLGDLVDRMERDCGLYLLAAGRKPSTSYTSRVTGELVPTAPSFTSWLFCVRTSLWGALDAPSFGYDELVLPGGDDRVIYDTGAVLLAQMMERGLGHAFMPRRFRMKYFHYGSMTALVGGAGAASESPHGRLKRYQQRDVQRRVGLSGRGGKVLG
jgi:hypothetical protein